MTNSNSITTNRFVIRKSLIGKNTIITFKNKKNETVSYNHADVYNKYKSYTNSNNIPAFCRNLAIQS